MRKKYPSQIKYEENNPTITFRMTKEEKTEIEQMAEDSGKSISELVRIALLGLKENFKETLERKRSEGYRHGENNGKRMGKEEGLAEGKDKYAIRINCWRCHKPICIEPNSPYYDTIIRRTSGYIEHYPGCPL